MIFIPAFIAGGLLVYAAWNILTNEERTRAAIDRRLQEDVPCVANRYKIT